MKISIPLICLLLCAFTVGMQAQIDPYTLIVQPIEDESMDIMPEQVSQIEKLLLSQLAESPSFKLIAGQSAQYRMKIH